MAIKGKKKPKARSGRVVTAGPRPAYVAPKVPLFQKTGAKFTLALIAEAIIFSLLVGFGEQSQTDHQRERVEEFTSLIETNLAGAGEVIQPLPGGAQVLPQLPARLAELGSEQPPEEEVVLAETEAWASAVTDAADGVAGVEVPAKGMDEDQYTALIEVQSEMDRALRLFAGLATDLGVAVQVDGDARTELIANIQAQHALVARAFDAAYGKLLQVRRLLDLDIGSAAATGGFPTGVAPQEGIPGFEPPVFEEGVPVEESDGNGGGKGGAGEGGGGGGNG